MNSIIEHPYLFIVTQIISYLLIKLAYRIYKKDIKAIKKNFDI